MDVQMMVRTKRLVAGLSMRELALASGVSPSTVSRIEAGALDPRTGVFVRIMAALGVDLEASLGVASATTAVVGAARHVLGDLDELTPEAASWVDRFERMRWIDRDQEPTGDPADLARRAGRLSPLAARSGLVTLVDDIGQAEIVRRLCDSGVDSAVSGPAAMGALGARVTNPTSVLYVEDAAAAERALGLDRYTSMSGLPVMVLPFDGLCEVGRSDGWVTPVQAVIDGFAGPIRMPEMADAVVARWADAAA